MNLTPKEKAIELVDKLFNSEHCQKNHFPNNNFCECVDMNMYQAKQCAIISVDTVLETIMTGYLTNHKEVANFQIEKMVYWQQVKEELIKLKR